MKSIETATTTTELANLAEEIMGVYAAPEYSHLGWGEIADLIEANAESMHEVTE